MTEQELRDLISNDLVRIVTTDKKFYLVTTHATMCQYDIAPETLIGHVRCWCVEQVKWVSIDPAKVFAYKSLNHPIENAVALN